MDLGLKAKNNAQKVVLDYLEANVSEVLAEKIKSGNKTMDQCWTYIIGQAEKQKDGKVACISDMEVFGWAIHFFEEDKITAKEEKPAVKVVVSEKKPEPKKVEKKKEEKTEMLPGQMSIFDFWEGANES